MSVSQYTQVSQLTTNNSMMMGGGKYIRHQRIEPQNQIISVSSMRRVEASSQRFRISISPGIVEIDEGGTNSDAGSAGRNWVPLIDYEPHV